MQPLAPRDPRTVGEFRLSARLGLGGMGQVFLGHSPGGRAVAVKICHPELAADPAFVARFAREATAAQAVNGLYTAQVVAAGPYDRPPWMATAYVPGPSLTDYVHGYGPLPEPAVWRLAAGLAEALLAVHACGLVHRDLKPSNVLLAVDGPRVIDFGIASALEGPGLTSTGSVMGSPPYMSPEQATGMPTGPASDVFALGSTLAFAASGAPPFGDGDAPALLFRVVHMEPALGSVPERLRGVLAACLAKDPGARPTLPQLLRACQDGVAAGGNSAASFWPSQMTAVIARHEAESATAGRPDGAVSSRVPAMSGGTVPAGGLAPLGGPPAGDPPAWEPRAGGHHAGGPRAGGPRVPHPPTVASAPGTRFGRGGLIGRRRVLYGLAGLIAAGGVAAGWELAGSGGGTAAAGTTTGRVTDKRVAWVHQAAAPVRTGAAISPDRTTLYVGCDTGTVYALNAATGGVERTYAAGGAVSGITLSGVGQSGDTLLVGGADGAVHAFNTGNTGATWSSPAAGAAITGPPTSGGQVVYAGSDDHYVYALDIKTGQRKWRADIGGAAMPSQPAGTGVVWAGSQDGTMYVLDTGTGTIVAKVAVGGPVGAAPLTVTGQVYLGTTKGVLYDLFYDNLTTSASSAVQWNFPADGAITGTPVPLGNGDAVVAATAQGTVYAVRPGSAAASQPGTAVLTYHAGGPIRSGLAVSNGVIYAGSDDGYLYAVDFSSGELRWKYRAGAAIRSSILVAGGLVFFGTLDHRVYALHV